ncbi:hypothetical protein SNE40_016841 [Patella caerulea]|uniref:Transposase n=1 Tax=Patella caerulea TaxID=87958 RepID=A0AAN8JCF4_PATCE
MGRKSSLTEIQRAQAVTLKEEGYSIRNIARRLRISKTAVHNAVLKFNTDGNFRDRKRSGRPRKTTQRDNHLIKRVVQRSPYSSLPKLHALLLQKGTKVSKMTISRRLSGYALKSYKPARKPLLTKTMKTKRLAFAMEHRSWTVADWSHVLFSDESMFEQFTSRQRFVRRPVGKRFDERFTVPTMKHPPSIMVWGAFSSCGTAGLYFLPKGQTMNGQRYEKLLEEKLLLHMEVHKCSIFMQDGAPCHRSKLVSDFLKKKKIRVLTWPGNSPDLNPIENLWRQMKDQVAKRQPSNMNELLNAIKLTWINISKEYCQTLIDSMPHRVEQVIASRGGHTKY